MKKLLLSLAFLAFMFVGCSSNGSSSESTAESFVEALYDGDADKVVSYIQLPKEVMKQEGGEDLIKGKIKMGLQQNSKVIQQHGKISNIEAKKVGSDSEDSANVKVTVTFEDKETKTENISLKKVDGTWKVLLK